MNFKVGFLSFATIIFLSQVGLASPWAGPPLSMAGGLLSLSRPSNYVVGGAATTLNSAPYLETQGKLNLVLLQDKENSLQGALKVQQTDFPKGGIFSDSSQTALPTQLTDFDFSSSYNHGLTNGDDWGLLGSFGSDSNVPFNSVYEFEWQVTGMYHDRVDALHSWVFFLNYSLTRSFLPGIPLPGLGYLTIDPKNHTQIFIGLPFFLAWQPDPDWSLSVSYFIPTNIDGEISRRLSERCRMHFNFQWTNELWFIAGRADNQQHLIFDQKKVQGGLRTTFGEEIFTDLTLGFSYDQNLLLGHSITDHNMPNITLPIGLLARGDIAYRF